MATACSLVISLFFKSLIFAREEAVGGLVASMIVYPWLIDLRLTRIPDIFGLLVISGGLGMLIGFFVPSWYRNAHGYGDLEGQIEALEAEPPMPPGVARIGERR